MIVALGTGRSCGSVTRPRIVPPEPAVCAASDGARVKSEKKRRNACTYRRKDTCMIASPASPAPVPAAGRATWPKDGFHGGRYPDSRIVARVLRLPIADGDSDVRH